MIAQPFIHKSIQINWLLVLILTPPYFLSEYSLILLFCTVDLKTVVRLPNLWVPPIWPVLCSGISITTACFVSSLTFNQNYYSALNIENSKGIFTSVEWASFKPNSFLANSTTAAWKPKQMPRNGLSLVRHHLTASILPSTPRLPKPPGTTTQL